MARRVTPTTRRFRRCVLTNALVLAAQTYEDCAKNVPELREIFEKQAREAREAVQQLDDFDIIALTDA